MLIHMQISKWYRCHGDQLLLVLRLDDRDSVVGGYFKEEQIKGGVDGCPGEVVSREEALEIWGRWVPERHKLCRSVDA